MNNSSKALIVSIAQAVTLVGSAAILVFTKSTSLVWFSFPISETVIFVLSIVFLKEIYGKYLSEGHSSLKVLKTEAVSGNM